MALSRERPPVTARRPLILVTDAWHPQVNGVVHTWSYVQRELDQLGHSLHVIHPAGSRGVRVPGEPDLLLSTEPARHLKRVLGARTPAALHIATEGPLGWAARRSEEHTSELQSRRDLVCRPLPEKKKQMNRSPPLSPTTPTNALP